MQRAGLQSLFVLLNWDNIITSYALRDPMPNSKMIYLPTLQASSVCAYILTYTGNYYIYG